MYKKGAILVTLNKKSTKKFVQEEAYKLEFLKNSNLTVCKLTSQDSRNLLASFLKITISIAFF